MRIIGLNITKTSEGISLYDGAVALLEDGIVTMAIAEERVNRIKYSGGIKNALTYIFKYKNLSPKDIDYFVFSSCADLPPKLLNVMEFLNEELPELSDISPEKILICPSHHLSHAASCFFASPFEEALILVADNEGNIIGEKKHKEYWLNRIERTSVFIGKRNEIKLIARFNDGENELGIGAAYNYFTKWCGFRTYHDAGKTMALAAFGSGKFKHIKVMKFDSKYEKLNIYPKFDS